MQGYLRRLDVSELPHPYILRDYGHLECSQTSFSLSVTPCSVQPEEEQALIRLLHPNGSCIILQANTNIDFNNWYNAFANVTTPPKYRVSLNEMRSGHTAIVLGGVSELNGVVVAVKVLSRIQFPVHALVETILTRFLLTYQHDYPYGIVRCLATYHTPTETHSVMELSGPNLEVWIKRHGPPSEQIAQSIVIQAATALDFFHKRGIVHGAVGVKNLMVRTILPSGHLEVRLGGFSSAWFRDMETGQCLPRRTIDDMRRGKHGIYLSPESLCALISPAMDFWSLGVMLYRFLVGRLPFVGFNDTDRDSERRVMAFGKLTSMQARQSILFRPDDEYCQHLSEESKHFVTALLAPNAEERLNMDTLKKHPWMRGALLPVKRKKGTFASVYKGLPQTI